MPTLTTNNQYMFLANVGEVFDDIPDEQRKLFRKVRGPERLALQGFPKSLALLLQKRCIVAAGNAYPPPLIVAVLYPMLQALKASGLDLREWPSAAKVSKHVPMSVYAAGADLKKVLTLTATGKAKAKAKPRCKSKALVRKRPSTLFDDAFF
eukprot:7685128-Karenia_brevis.AAC.1